MLAGEQGSAKSTFSAVLRKLLDPNCAPLRALPREDRDLFIAANNGHVLTFDNVSGLPGWISDTLCRLATGDGFAVRQLYTDQDEVLFDAARPVILNGIEDMVTRPDLADRAPWSRSRKRRAVSSESFGPPSKRSARGLSVRCWTPSRTGCACCPAHGSRGCRAWETLIKLGLAPPTSTEAKDELRREEQRHA